MCDLHVIKMVSESVQLLATAHRILDGKMVFLGKKRYYLLENEELLRSGEIVNKQCYLQTHANHPSAVWTRSGNLNYEWLYQHTMALNDEFVKRYPGSAKVHLAWSKNKDFLRTKPANIPYVDFTDPPQAMPLEFKQDDTVKAYKAFYIGAKSKFAVWKHGNVPSWYLKM